jgi:hypothetical protein
MIRDPRAPIDATWIGEWDGHARGFNAGDWAVTHAAHDGHGDIHITVHGVQYGDGRTVRKIVVDCPSEITPDEARKLSAALTAAAEAAERA